ncbi:MAG: amidohydrolase family protein, partial [bacterium]
NKGIQIWRDEDLFKKAKDALDQNFFIAFHAIGDAALDQALRLGEALAPQLEKVLNHFSQKLFHRLEHLQVCRDDQIEKIQKQNLWSLGLQPSHRVADSTFVLNRLGEERCLKNSYRLKSFLDTGLKVSLGSDAPIVSSNPLQCLKASTQDPRACEKISLSQSFELMIRRGRQNTGFEVKNLGPQSRAWLSNYE